MTERRRKKKNKLRGHRSHGQGDTKNNRGAGSRGGVGRAGSHKHKYSLYYEDFGGKKKMKSKKIFTSAVQLWRINQALPEMIEKGEVEKKGDKIIIDGKKLGIEKIIGPGKMPENIVFENVKLSKNLSGEKKTEESEDDN